MRLKRLGFISETTSFANETEFLLGAEERKGFHPLLLSTTIVQAFFANRLTADT
jgi:hypothetical protein